MGKLQDFIAGKMLVWLAKREGYSEEDMDSGIVIMTVNDLKADKIEVRYYP